MYDRINMKNSYDNYGLNNIMKLNDIILI